MYGLALKPKINVLSVHTNTHTHTPSSKFVRHGE